MPWKCREPEDFEVLSGLLHVFPLNTGLSWGRGGEMSSGEIHSEDCPLPPWEPGHRQGFSRCSWDSLGTSPSSWVEISKLTFRESGGSLKRKHKRTEMWNFKRAITTKYRSGISLTGLWRWWAQAPAARRVLSASFPPPKGPICLSRFSPSTYEHAVNSLS